jgi:phenylpropionate dioxygenase-like ring-hydroxylating dioxygenase large terminal subunit
VPPGAIVPVEVDGTEFVVWRSANGTLASAPRSCPHLDFDLADGMIVNEELQCGGHGWSFDCHGHAFKRNELGRVDPKDDLETLTLTEHDGIIRVAR